VADIRNWAEFIRGRWHWKRYGYERGFPRGSGFTDIDAATEFDGRSLVIEPKHHDGIGVYAYPSPGQLGFLRDEVRRGKTAIVLYGCGACNNPHAVCVLGNSRSEDRWERWSGKDLRERRHLLKAEIDVAMGLADEPWPTIRRPPDWRSP
jgi:hypothetical protein